MKHSLAFTLAALLAIACGRTIPETVPGALPVPAPATDPRENLRAGLLDPGEAVWNLRVLSRVPPPESFRQAPNSDLAFVGNYAIQGNFNGFQIWDISNPKAPVLKTAYVCPASQSDVSVYKNLLFVSGEDLAARVDCGTQGVKDTVSTERLRGLRIFDISDITNPRNVGNVQTCRGSHTHSLLVDPKDTANVYVYISGSAPVRSPSELAGCSNELSEKDTASALFRIEVIKVPVARPERAAIVSSPRIFHDLAAPPQHGDSPEDVAAAAKQAAEARARGGFTAKIDGVERAASSRFTRPLLDSIVRARGGTGEPTAADSAALRAVFQDLVDRYIATIERPKIGPTQCHDITLYPEVGLAGGACEGYGMLLDIRNPERPVRLAAVADSNFSYWHSATLSNDGSKILFSDEWGGGGAPKCRATDKREWGANAIFASTGGNLQFKSYYKLPAAQSALENCVAHNGSLIPIPGRDVMVQAWYQGGVSVFDWTDPNRPKEIAFFDRGPVDSTRMAFGGSWSAYWYHGVIVSSEIVRGLDIMELAPSEFLSQNEIDAAKTVVFDYFNAQSQQKFVWPPSFALARAYADQLERSRGLDAERIAAVRHALADAEKQSGTERRNALAQLAARLDGDTAKSGDAAKVRLLATAVRDLGAQAE